MKSDESIAALNELQNLKAAENVYFSDWEKRDYVRDQFLAVKNNRPKEWSKIIHLVFDGEDERGERYREGSLAEAKKAGKSLVQMSFKYPQPTKWFAPLKFRSKLKTFSNGTAVGHVRTKEWLEKRGP